MEDQKKYQFWDFIWLPIKYIPFQSFFTIFYSVLNALMPVVFTLILANFINVSMEIFSRKRNYSDIILPILFISFYVLFMKLMPNISKIISLTGKNKMNLKMQELVLNKYTSLEYMHIENSETKDLIQRVSENPTEKFFEGFENILASMSLFLTSLSLLIVVMTSTFLGGLLILIISIPLFYLASKIGKQNYELDKTAKSIQRRSSYLFSVLTSRKFADERSLFKYSDKLRNEYENFFDKSFVIEKKIEKKSYVTAKSGSITTLLIVAVILLILLPSLNNQSMELGIFIALTNAIFGLVQSMSWRLSNAMQNHACLKEYLADFNEFFKLSQKEDLSFNDNLKETTKFKFKTLEFKGVSFKYPGTSDFVLNNCSFLLTNDKSYSFVGENGAGKTTIIKLITGLYDNYHGEILINEKNIKEFDFQSLKSMISVVFQDFNHYELTLKESIALGKIGEENDEEMRKIVQLLGLEYLVMKLKNGFNTYLGKINSEGVELSGGEMQRFAIARMMYSQAEINILDEPTSALDPIAESEIYSLFNRISNNKFAIYITHRLGAAKMADEIIVISQGEVVEIGCHEELVSKKSGLYKSMFDSQSSWYQGLDGGTL